MRDSDVTEVGRADLAPDAGDPTFDRSPVAIAHLDTGGRFLRVNDRLCELLGHSSEELIGSEALRFIHPDDADQTVESFETAVARADGYQVDRRLRRADGRWTPVRVTLSPITDEDGTVDRLLVHAEDRSAEVLALEAAQQAAQRYERLLAGAADIIMLLDADGTIDYVSPNVRDVLGYERASMLGERFGKGVHPDDGSIVERTFQRVVKTGQPGSALYRVRTAEGALRWFELRCTDRRHEPTIEGFVCNIRDVTERIEVEQRLRHQALHDPVTGLPNRTLLADRVETAISRAERSGSTFAILFCDLDHFKHVNDTLGHEAGDQLLQEVAVRLRRAVRSSDTLARIGGDEFVLLAEQLGADEASTQAEALGEALLQTLHEPLLVDGHLVTASTSVGVVVYHGGRDTSALLRDADVAMYAAKAAGRGRVVIHDDRMQADAEARFETDVIIRRALSHGGVAVEFQPIVNLTTQRVVGAEALVRLDVDGTRYQPAAFIDAAEESGAIVPIGEEVLLVALEELHQWPTPMYVSVNMSARQLAGADLADRVLGAIAASRVDPRRLVIEVTEVSLVESSDHLRVTTRRLHDAGVRIALDDFGTGFSSLSYLRQFPVSIVKIDQSFVRGVSRIGSGDIEVIRAVIGLAGSLGIQVIAEGIETEIEAAILNELGCTHGQGFLYGRPSEIFTPAPTRAVH